MEIMKIILPHVLIMLVIGCSSTTDHEVMNTDKPFIGSWSTMIVIKDGVLQTDWSDARLIIHQEDETKGTYQMVSSPNDSIWSTTGSWSDMEDQLTIILDDEIEVMYRVKGDTLHMSKHLPSTSVPCVPTEKEPCVLGLTGQWEFIFKQLQ